MLIIFHRPQCKSIAAAFVILSGQLEGRVPKEVSAGSDARSPECVINYLWISSFGASNYVLRSSQQNRHWTSIIAVMFARQALRSAQPIRTVSYALAADYRIINPYTPSVYLVVEPDCADVSYHQQGFRRYATEAPQNNSNSRTAIYAAVAVTAAAGGYYYYSQTRSGLSAPTAQAPPSREEEKTIPPSTDKSAVFTGGNQGWVPLKLESVETINHNTKKFRFSLPDKDSVSGLHIACWWTRNRR